MKIAYFVHNLNDPAVHRRVRMLHAGGATVALIGFCRGESPPQVEGCVPINLGRTHDARLLQRVVATLGAVLSIARVRQALADAEVVMARQLEMLVIAARARRRYAPDASLVFECLDIHRLMVARSGAGRAMRFMEARLLRQCQLLVVSSQGFMREHFSRFYRRLPPVLIAENKVLAEEVDDCAAGRAMARPAGPPWRIGWFGNIRCRRSLVALAGITRRFPGKVSVIIRGRPAFTAVPDFHEIVAAHPGITFAGAYDRRSDLPRMYGDVHFAWAIDFFEAGGNSDWLLPNRLYEGSLFGAVSLAMASVETGRWLATQRAGVLLSDPLEASVDRFFAGLDEVGYGAARAAVQRIPIGALVDDDSDCQELVTALAGVRA
jgi:hypothetical protein